ncbi:PcfJ domain-containing protein [Sphingobacterium sp. Mn56C]|uniref:PcfJ domain-containing protein n=1 Tax=Sphingobacterium sp. Mn56C TaxID=3395261 RepID=UPI003BEE41CE
MGGPFWRGLSNKYYLQKDSLILSAQIDGKRIETVEVSLNKMEVVQSRGLQNRASEYNKDIVDLVNKNMHQISKRMEATG